MDYSPLLTQNEPEIVPQKKKGLEIIPFHEDESRPLFSKDYLAQVYRRIVREETVYKVFYDGSVRNTNDFIQFFTNKDHQVFFVQYDGEEVGFFWLTRFRHQAAFINYCFYKAFWGDKALKISRLCIDFVFEGKNRENENGLDVLLGLTPATNTLAIKFLLKNGMTVLGRVPGVLYDFREESAVDGILSYKQRNDKSKLRAPLFSFFSGMAMNW